MIWRLLMVCILAGACAAPDPTVPPPTEAPPALAEAHEAWLAGDLVGLVRCSREVLSAPGATEAVRANLAALLDRAWAAGDGRLPADWTLRAPVTALHASVIRKEEPSLIRHRLVVSGRVLDPEAITDLEVAHVGSGVLLHRGSGQGTWSSEAEADDHYFELESEEREAPPPEGLYTVRITLAEGPPIEGWFPLVAQRASRSPRLIHPTAGAVLTTPTPTIEWEDFHSPEIRGYERRAVSLYSVRREAGRWQRAWSMWALAPTRNRATVGDDPRTTAPPLRAGRHWMSVTWSESRRFGPMALKRAARTSVPFEVRP